MTFLQTPFLRTCARRATCHWYFVRQVQQLARQLLLALKAGWLSLVLLVAARATAVVALLEIALKQIQTMTRVLQLRSTGKARRIVLRHLSRASVKLQTHFLRLFSGTVLEAAASANVHRLLTTKQDLHMHRRMDLLHVPALQKKVDVSLQALPIRWLPSTAEQPVSCAETMSHHQSTSTRVVAVMNLTAMNASSHLVLKARTLQRAQNG